jgi:hypothetical protein
MPDTVFEELKGATGDVFECPGVTPLIGSTISRQGSDRAMLKNLLKNR